MKNTTRLEELAGWALWLLALPFFMVCAFCAMVFEFLQPDMCIKCLTRREWERKGFDDED